MLLARHYSKPDYSTSSTTLPPVLPSPFRGVQISQISDTGAAGNCVTQ